MARSRNDRIRRRIGKAIISGTLSSAGTMTASGVGTTLHANFDSSGALLNSDSAGYADGSLHYLSKLKKMYMWDDSDGQFFELTGLDSAAAAGSGPTYSFQGSSYGYILGGKNPAFPPPVGPTVNTIEKFPFTSDTNSSDVGDLTRGATQLASQNSETSGYTSGGVAPDRTVIEKFSFSTDGNASDVGDLTLARASIAGQSSSSSGYTSGGSNPNGGMENVIDKFPFSSDANASDVGDLTVARKGVSGQTSSSSGYTSGGFPGPVAAGGTGAYANTVDKFPFSADANATDVGDLTVVVGRAASQSSTTHGYTSSGTPGSTTIDKFSFSTDGNATDVGDLSQTRRFIGGGSSSTDNGYTGPGLGPPYINNIDKFPFSSDANATDVGDATQAKIDTAGTQV